MRNSPRTLISLSAALVLLGPVDSVAMGQTLDAVPPSSRIRIDLPSADRGRFGRERSQSIIGTFNAVDADTVQLLVRVGADPLRVPRATIRNIYVSRGRPPRWRAALEGAVVPAILAGTLSAVGANIRQQRGDPSPSSVAMSAAAWAAASGAVLGAWSPPERWQRLTVQNSSAKR